MKARIVTVNDALQRKYRYTLTAPVGRNFDPEFRPQLTPKEMLELGVFDGHYLNNHRKEFPTAWFKKAKLSATPDPKLNYFGVHASQPWAVWKKKGWIHPQDPLGWFQWYCRYYMGRRSDDDARQIKRWKAMRRHIWQIKKNCKVGDFDCHRKQRQAVMHWAYDSRKM
ncbi:MAG TPA: hypothetical protein VMU11_04440 [Verrucomicrobiae bacterium]|nr:hypothetical protein [Verrucomicrobiae bacterium]